MHRPREWLNLHQRPWSAQGTSQTIHWRIRIRFRIPRAIHSRRISKRLEWLNRVGFTWQTERYGASPFFCFWQKKMRWLRFEATNRNDIILRNFMPFEDFSLCYLRIFRYAIWGFSVMPFEDFGVNNRLFLRQTERCLSVFVYKPFFRNSLRPRWVIPS